MEKELYKGGPGWVEPKISNEWIEILNQPRLIKRTPGVDESAATTVKMCTRPRGMSCFMVKMPPGGDHGSHGHTQGAVFYVLEGKGHEVHDGIRYDWETGDAVIVHDGGSVHQHFNDDPERPARMLVFTYPRAYDGQNLVAGDLVKSPKGKTAEEAMKQIIWREGAAG
ncbi:cupin domain-containing protein [Candidatus Omnitrophota bacterium]